MGQDLQTSTGARDLYEFSEAIKGVVKAVQSEMTSDDIKKGLGSGNNVNSILEAGIYPLEGITHVIFLGASISDGMVNGMESCIAEEFKRNGLDITVIDEAVGGRGVEATFSAWESNKANYTDKKALVMIHTLGNDVSDYRPWSTLADSVKNTLYYSMKSLINSIWQNGNLPLLVNTSFRAYDNGDAILNEDIGSKPFNDNIIAPLSKEMFPCNWLNGAPYIDWYDFYRNRNFNILNSDGIHSPNYTINRRFYVNNIIRRLKGLYPLRDSRINDPTNRAEILPVPALIHFCVEPNATGDSEFIFGAHQIYSTGDHEDINLSPLHGYEPSSINMSTFFAASSIQYGSNSTDLSDNDITKTPTHDYCKQQYTYTQSESYVKHSSFNGFNPNQEVDIYISAFRNSDSTARVGEYSVDNGESSIKIDASTNNKFSHVGKLTAVADENGEFSLVFRCDGSTSSKYAYVNAIMLDPK